MSVVNKNKLFEIKYRVIAGEVINNIKVIKEVRKNKKRYAEVEFLLCKHRDIQLVNKIFTKKNLICKKCKHKNKDFIGSQIGYLYVLEKIHGPKVNNKDIYKCICHCGNIVIRSQDALKYNNPKTSCGCLRQNNRQNSSNTRLYIAKYINPQVLERDNYTCQKCYNQECDLHVHHIFDYATYPELRKLICNLVTLCSLCHRNDFHKVYPPNTSNTLSDLETWLGTPYKYRSQLLNYYNKYYK